MKGDVYILFMEKSSNLLSVDGYSGFIIQNKFMRAAYGEKLREELSNNNRLLRIVDLHDSPVFDISAYPSIIIRQNKTPSDDHEISWIDIKSNTKSQTESKLQKGGVERQIRQSDLGGEFWHSFAGENSFEAETVELSNLCRQIGKGAVSGNTSVYLVSDTEIEEYDLEEEYILSVLRGGDVVRYEIEPEENLSNLIYPYSVVDGEPDLADPDQIPNIISYLEESRDELETRKNYGERLIDQGYEWYELTYNAPGMLNEKIVFPDISPENRFAHDENGEFACLDTVYYLVRETVDDGFHSDFLTAVLNSQLMNSIFENISPKVRGGYKRYKTQYVESLPIPTTREIENTSGDLIYNITSEFANNVVESEISGTDDPHDALVRFSTLMKELKSQKRLLNISILDHIGSSYERQPITDVGLTQPPRNAANSKLQYTSKQHPNLRVGSTRVDRESPNTVLIKATARYKPDDEDAYDTDQWGYTETDYLPAFRITDLTKTEADLIEHFVPVAVDKAGGFVNFRETATKTNSLVDRLKAIELPDVDDVADDLENYLETVERAEELDEKIEETDDLIDEIVYELYGLTDEETKIVEEAVS